MLPWWTQKTDCSIKELVRAINGTLQTRIARLSLSANDVRKEMNFKTK